ncbi:MAG: hypothetical protein U9O98_00140 [Asgard group archaeon]|nr:hypothetical protein [Asgard group archaeon]
MKKGIKITIIVTMIIVILGSAGFLTYFFLFNPLLFKSCVAKPFTEYPVDMDRLEAIIPLGNLNPPGHTYPTDHIYFFTNHTAYPDGLEIYAPEEITITTIEYVEYDPPQIAGVSTDYTIDFAVCSQVSGQYGHVNNISSFLSDQIGDFGDPVNCYEIDNRTFTVYSIKKNIEVEAGQLLGRACIGGGGFDFWLKDQRVNLEWVNTDLSRHFQHTACPLAYFTEPLKSTLETKVSGWAGPVDPPGYCGRIDFDVPNTAQGIWAQEGKEDERQEEYGLALVYHNFNASKGAISIGTAGNSTYDQSVYVFTPTTSGYRNRNFSQVMNDGNIYYYYCDGFGFGGSYTKVIFIKMTSNRELLFQYLEVTDPLPSDPTALFNPAKAITYYR